MYIKEIPIIDYNVLITFLALQQYIVDNSFSDQFCVEKLPEKRL